MPKLKKEVTEEITPINETNIKEEVIKEEPKKETKKTGTVACF